jgi:ABC-type spermidine/putrescine transport system permease subunit I
MYSRWFLALLLVPFLLLLGFGLGLPLIDSVRQSLFGAESFGQAYAEMAASASFWSALGRTLRVAAVVTVACLLLGYPAAALIVRAGRSARLVMLALVLVPLMTNSIARVYGWVGTFQRNGLADQIAAAFGMEPLRLLYSQPVVMIGMVHSILSVVVLVLVAALERYDERLTQAARSLGAGFARTLFGVKLPALLHQLLSAGTLAFVFSLGFFVTPAVLGGGRDLLISVVIQQHVTDVFDLPRVQAMSLTLLAVTLAALAIAAAVSARLASGKSPDYRDVA